MSYDFCFVIFTSVWFRFVCANISENASTDSDSDRILAHVIANSFFFYVGLVIKWKHLLICFVSSYSRLIFYNETLPRPACYLAIPEIQNLWQNTIENANAVVLADVNGCSQNLGSGKHENCLLWRSIHAKVQYHKERYVCYVVILGIVCNQYILFVCFGGFYKALMQHTS